MGDRNGELKSRNNGKWTEAQFRAWIKSVLRKASMKWGPINETRKEARVSRGIYQCSGYGREPHNVRASKKIDDKRVVNTHVDHIVPIMSDGFTSWGNMIEAMFCERDNLQLLCHECHARKTKVENKRNN